MKVSPSPKQCLLFQWQIGAVDVSAGEVKAVLRAYDAQVSEIGILLPNNQRHHRALHIQQDVLPYACSGLSLSALPNLASPGSFPLQS